MTKDPSLLVAQQEESRGKESRECHLSHIARGVPKSENIGQQRKVTVKISCSLKPPLLISPIPSEFDRERKIGVTG